MTTTHKTPADSHVTDSAAAYDKARKAILLRLVDGALTDLITRFLSRSSRLPQDQAASVINETLAILRTLVGVSPLTMAQTAAVHLFVADLNSM